MMAAAGGSRPSTETAVAMCLAARISAHLGRISADPRLNPGRRNDKAIGAWIPDEAGVHRFYRSAAVGDRHRVRVVYVAHHGPSYLSIEDAAAHLAWLVAGNVGEHLEVSQEAKQ